jgi:hypothetical protein
MPVSKKPRTKKTGKTASRSGAATPVLPDRRVMERFLAAIGERDSDGPTEKAQDVMYAAWEQTSSPGSRSPAKRSAFHRSAPTLMSCWPRKPLGIWRKRGISMPRESRQGNSHSGRRASRNMRARSGAFSRRDPTCAPASASHSFY